MILQLDISVKSPQACGKLSGVRRVLRVAAVVLIGVAALAYLLDWASVRWRIPGNREVYADIRVDQVYTDTNKYNEIEYSHGNPVLERCVYSLFPHDGFRPCWWVTRHTMRITNTD
jgi:hypothetical protein